MELKIVQTAFSINTLAKSKEEFSFSIKNNRSNFPHS